MKIVSRFLASRKRLERVAIRHTVGMDDRVEGEGGVADQKENAGARYFKLKLNGDPAHDADRLIRIGAALATLPYDYRVTLDANEQYADLAVLSALVERLDRDAALRPIAAKLLYIEQPMPRDITPAKRRSARWRGAISSSTRPMTPTMRFRSQGRSAIAASPRNPARASTSRSSTRRARRNGAQAAKNASSPART